MRTWVGWEKGCNNTFTPGRVTQLCAAGTGGGGAVLAHPTIVPSVHFLNCGGLSFLLCWKRTLGSPLVIPFLPCGMLVAVSQQGKG